jgi:hypothetical protein
VSSGYWSVPAHSMSTKEGPRLAEPMRRGQLLAAPICKLYTEMGDNKWQDLSKPKLRSCVAVTMRKDQAIVSQICPCQISSRVSKTNSNQTNIYFAWWRLHMGSASGEPCQLATDPNYKLPERPANILGGSFLVPVRSRVSTGRHTLTFGIFGHVCRKLLKCAQKLRKLLLHGCHALP